ncbi:MULTISPECIES: biotin/lipoyl-containing protein, partial [Rothia]
MSHTVVLPALGESVTEGTVTRWLVEVGDTIEVDAPLVEVSTDKVDTEVPSPV